MPPRLAMLSRFLVVCLACALSHIVFARSGAAEELSGAAETLVFENDVRPILKAHCFQCHGEGGKREGDLDVRLRRFLIEGGESGAVLVPGEPDDSYFLERIRNGEMPPGDTKLSAADIRVLRQWVAGGAKTAREEPDSIGDELLLTKEDREFWSFQPIRRPPLPSVTAGRAVRTPIDAFVLARLERAGLGFSAEADRATLIRRVYFDLTGLPPTPDEIDQFLADRSPDAYQRLVDRVLASPRYGERWGRHWLDVAGYADSEGYTEQDTVRPWAFFYRDYVIRSFNSDKPFDRFVLEQLAGDEMIAGRFKNMTPQQVELLTATGFLRMAADGTGASGVDQPVARNEVIADTINIVSSSLLGLSVGCARCHDHRYDPISQRDYYRVRAVFEPAYDWKKWRTPSARRISLYSDADRAVAARIEAEAVQVDGQRREKTQQYIERTLTEELDTVPEAMREPLRLAYRTAAKDRSDEQKALLKQHPSVASISAGSLYLYDRRRDERARKLDAERRQKEQRFVQAARKRALAEVPEALRDELIAARDAAVQTRTDRQRQLLKDHPGVAAVSGDLAKLAPDAADELKRDKAAAEKLRSEKAADDLKRYSERAAAIRATIPRQKFIRALTEPPGHLPATYLFHRGDHEQPKEQLEAAELSVLRWTKPDITGNSRMLKTSGRRLAYARHLTNGRHPLLARVLVNRLWMHHFGRGIVNTPADFGLLGDRPTHPELLDWLADEFQRGGWQAKRIHRQLLLSATYRQVSTRTNKLEEIDPDNTLYGRMSVRRLEAEVIRDSVLAVSGKLNGQMYGEPVPVMEDEVGQIVLGKESLDGERKPTKPIPLNGHEFRRSLYVQVRRSRPLAVLETFDLPETTPNCPQRVSSNVAPQSLLLMNSAFLTEYAEHFARRVVDQAPDEVADRIDLAWQLAWGRKPDVDQRRAAVEFLNRQTELFGSDKIDREGASPEHLALATFCQALLSANPFIYVD